MANYVKRVLKMKKRHLEAAERIDTLVYMTLAHVHTYIIGHYNPSVSNIDLVSHTGTRVERNFALIII